MMDKDNDKGMVRMKEWLGIEEGVVGGGLQFAMKRCFDILTA